MTTTGTLEVTTPTEREIVLTRVFAAPRSLVFDAWTRPELLKRWFGSRGGWSMTVCEVDLQVGGSYHFVWRKGSDGPEIGFHGVYREIVPPERIVNTESFDGHPGEALNTTVLVEHDGKTTCTLTALYPSQEVRDSVLKTGMKRGVAESYDVLDEYLASIVRRSSATLKGSPYI